MLRSVQTNTGTGHVEDCLKRTSTVAAVIGIWPYIVKDALEVQELGETIKSAQRGS
jgi:hypothetical protein